MKQMKLELNIFQCHPITLLINININNNLLVTPSDSSENNNKISHTAPIEKKL